jgi:NAD(P)-dependent dehydrogenase (short-subunit alcohol dehydrogenase family)
MIFDPRTIVLRADELAGRIVAVTGASDGIGKAVALACAQHGAQLVLIGRSTAKLELVHKQIKMAGGAEASIGILDLESALAREYDAFADALHERYGRLDGLVHNAGILGTLSPIEHYDVPTWCRVLHVNLTAAFALTQVLLPLLKKSTDASIIFTTSGVGRRARAYWGAYAVSKFGIEGMTQILAAELENISAIRVNALNPGRARTRMRRQAFPSENLESLPDPAALSASYLALLGPASRGVSGMSFDCQSEPPSVPHAARVSARETARDQDSDQATAGQNACAERD